ncbi:MAG: hypothetical protein JSS55_10435 [Proteobacteria bacterium]|nr:hypothetical protein [Pseudomonadota bacterium]
MNQRHEIRLDWLVYALRLYRDLLEESGKDRKAEEIAAVADDLSFGVGILAQNIRIESGRAAEIERAAITATHADLLVPLGLSDHSREWSGTREALFWLAQKMSKLK